MNMILGSEAPKAVAKDAYKVREAELRVELLNAQFDLRDSRRSLLVLVAGDDAEATEEVVDLLHEWLDARYLTMEAFLERTPEERAHPLFWRYWRALAPRGRIGVFLGAWVFDAIVGRLRGEWSEDEHARFVDHARSLEQALAADGTVILKLWFHTPMKELKKRRRKVAKGRPGWMMAERHELFLERYDEIVALGERFLQATHGPATPWEVIGAPDDRARNLAVLEALRHALCERCIAPPPDAPPGEVARQHGNSTDTSALAEVDLDRSVGGAEYRRRLRDGQMRLGDLAIRAHLQGLPTVLVFEGWDAAGKGGVIRRLTRAMAAQHYRVVPIAAPTSEEHAYHYLWRFWRRLPRSGRMTIFDRSWYGRVLVERVEGFAREDEWRRAFDEIVEFEAQLIEHGTLLLKFWLHIDPDEQLRRFQARARTPYKKYKFTEEDLRNREQWGAYEEAAQEMIRRTHRTGAPWLAVSANDKRWARLRVLEAVCDGLEDRLGKPR